MKFRIVGHVKASTGIARATWFQFRAHRHVEHEGPGPADVLVYAFGHTYIECVGGLLKLIDANAARSYVVVTSEHGEVPVGEEYGEYSAMKAAQKMVVRNLVHAGIPAVDVSPAFVLDSGRDKRVNRDEEYRLKVFVECRGRPPVLSVDVARAIVFAAENIEKITGTTIRVSAGWRM